MITVCMKQIGKIFDCNTSDILVARFARKFLFDTHITDRHMDSSLLYIDSGGTAIRGQIVSKQIQK